MDRIGIAIKNRLSLRAPQVESLEILAALSDQLELNKDIDLAAELEKVRTLYPTCNDFEREFPSLCFALATGVGKTRLMGAFIAYLYLKKGIKNFFVLAPNLTVYNKLIEDFSNPSHPKYVFNGIAEFATSRPNVVTGDNYQNFRTHRIGESDININVFNISKINAESRGGSQPRIKRLSEYLGEAYFDYLSRLEDLVLLMDESHHYRADRGMQVLNELKPILGLELTATPQVERGGKAIKFKNVVYEYSLARAIQDGFVKEPAVATRRNFNPDQHRLDELDRIKLEDGVRVHEDTKVALDIYSRDSGLPLVKPFMLVVAKDTGHAGELMNLIQSTRFFDGRYRDKVMEIHSNQSGSEKEENVAQLLTLESPDNRIEIVIHVNMLKEGWDVTNLYTIVPLRTAASVTLREQTIGRGLRLPYGKRTGNAKVDKLTIIAHDKFQEIIDAANRPDSIIRQENIIELDEMDLGRAKEVVTAISIFEGQCQQEREQIEQTYTIPEQKAQAIFTVEAKQTIYGMLPELSREVKSVEELSRPEIKELVIAKVKERIKATKQMTMLDDEKIKAVEEQYEIAVEAYQKAMIEIPRISIIPNDDVVRGFHDFDLDTSALNYQPVSKEIMVKYLRDKAGTIDVISGSGGIKYDSPENMLVSELINYPEIEYEPNADLLFKLAGQAVGHFNSYLTEEETANVVQYYRPQIAGYIFAQMKDHFFIQATGFKTVDARPFTTIYPWSFTKFTLDQIHDYRDTIEPTNTIPQKVFIGFKKSYHPQYKFDSKSEKDFTVILEDDPAVLKWLRPASKQFQIYWDHNSRQYEPDFIVETDGCICMVEIKKEQDVASDEVQAKAQAALLYCQNATDYTATIGGKRWSYVLIPHSSVKANMELGHLVRLYEIRN